MGRRLINSFSDVYYIVYVYRMLNFGKVKIIRCNR